MLNLSFVLSALIENRINYRVKWIKSTSAVEILTQGGVTLQFEDYGSGLEKVGFYKLSSISLFNYDDIC